MAEPHAPHSSACAHRAAPRAPPPAAQHAGANPPRRPRPRDPTRRRSRTRPRRRVLIGWLWRRGREHFLKREAGSYLVSVDSCGESALRRLRSGEGETGAESDGPRGPAGAGRPSRSLRARLLDAATAGDEPGSAWAASRGTGRRWQRPEPREDVPCRAAHSRIPGPEPLPRTRD